MHAVCGKGCGKQCEDSLFELVDGGAADGRGIGSSCLYESGTMVG